MRALRGSRGAPGRTQPASPPRGQARRRDPAPTRRVVPGPVRHRGPPGARRRGSGQRLAAPGVGPEGALRAGEAAEALVNASPPRAADEQVVAAALTGLLPVWPRAARVEEAALPCPTRRGCSACSGGRRTIDARGHTICDADQAAACSRSARTAAGPRRAPATTCAPTSTGPSTRSGTWAASHTTWRASARRSATRRGGSLTSSTTCASSPHSRGSGARGGSLPSRLPRRSHRLASATVSHAGGRPVPRVSHAEG